LKEAETANDHTYAVIINACVRCGDLDTALSLHDSMIEQHCASIQGATSTIKGLVTAGRFDQARTIFEEMSFYVPPIQPNVRTCNTYLRGCLIHGEIDRAMEVSNAMRTQWKVTEDESTVDYIVTLLCQGLRTEDAKKMMKGLKKKKKKKKKKESTKRGEDGQAPEIAAALAAPTEDQDPSLLVSLGRALALTGDVTACVNLMERASSLLSSSSSNFSTSSTSSTSSSSSTPSSGGRRAWKSGDDGRAFAASKFAEHRQRELGLEVDMIRKFVSSLTTTNSTSTVNTGTAASMQRVLTFPSGGRYMNDRPHALSDMLSHGLMTKFGGSLLLDEQQQAATKEYYRSIVTTTTDTIEGSGQQQQQQQHLNFDAVFRSSQDTNTEIVTTRPKKLKLEICAGAGEWAASQAQHDKEAANWVTLELRHGRVYQTFVRMVMERVNNLCVIGGDANVVMKHHIAPASMHNVYINHPEPPQQTGSRDGSQADHLLSSKFLSSIGDALVEGGLLCICTDNHWYAELLCNTISGLSKYTSLTSRSSGGMSVYNEVSGITLFSGVPNAACGVPVVASSYFDRMFQSGLSNHAAAFDRWSICVRKKKN
jgi:pentatricopeptide repeat protein